VIRLTDALAVPAELAACVCGVLSLDSYPPDARVALKLADEGLGSIPISLIADVESHIYYHLEVRNGIEGLGHLDRARDLAGVGDLDVEEDGREEPRPKVDIGEVLRGGPRVWPACLRHSLIDSCPPASASTSRERRLRQGDHSKRTQKERYYDHVRERPFARSLQTSSLGFLDLSRLWIFRRGFRYQS